MKFDWDRPVVAVVTAVCVMCIVTAIQSTTWRMEHDSTLYVYMGFLMNEANMIPYRDFFDVNMPLFHGFNFVFYRLFGNSDTAFRVADFMCVFMVMLATLLWTRRFGRDIAWFIAAGFVLLYWHAGPEGVLQRDFLTLIPISWAVCVAVFRGAPRVALRGATIGVLFCIAASIRPTAGLGLPAVLLFMLAEVREQGLRGPGAVSDFARAFVAAALGFGALTAAQIIALIRVDAFHPFIEIAKNYWPLYWQITGGKEIITGPPRIYYMLRTGVEFGGYSLLLAPAALGYYRAVSRGLLDPSQFRLAVFIAVMAAIYTIHVFINGKFFAYHWILFAYFTLAASSLCLIEDKTSSGRFARWFPIITLIAALLPSLAPPYAFLRPVLMGKPVTPKGGFVDEIADFLRPRLGPGDTVQPLEWSEVVPHAMLYTKTKSATRFIYDVEMYHHVSTPYIKGLRARLVAELTAAKPKFIVDYYPGALRVEGPDTSADFPELREFIRKNYTAVVRRAPQYVIYERAEPQ